MSAAVVTVCLLNWRRPENLRRVVDALAQQQPRPVIFLWNNAGGPLKLKGIDWQVDSSRNVGCAARWQMAVHAESEFVCSWDDDLVPKDPRLLADAVAALAGGPAVGLLGAYGVRMLPGKDYLGSSHISFPGTDEMVDIVKGRLLVARSADVRALPPCPPHYALADDLWLSAGVAGPHRVTGLFRGRIRELPAPHAVCNRPGHYAERDAAWRALQQQGANEVGAQHNLTPAGSVEEQR